MKLNADILILRIKTFLINSMYSSLLSLIDGNSFFIIQKNGIFVNIINYCIYYDLLYQNNLNMCYIFKIENEIIGYCYLDVICGKILAFEIFKPFQRKKFGLLFFNMLKKRYTNFDKFELILTSESISFWKYISKKNKWYYCETCLILFQYTILLELY